MKADKKMGIKKINPAAHVFVESADARKRQENGGKRMAVSFYCPHSSAY